MASREEEIEEQLEWEERKDSVPMHLHMLAGSCAGVAEHLCMFPIDTFKVRQQRLTPPSSRRSPRPHSSSLVPSPTHARPADAPPERRRGRVLP